MVLKIVCCLTFVFFSFEAVCQKSGDRRIIVSLPNDSTILQKVKIAFAKHDFGIREDGRKDTITTLLREFRTMPGFCILSAVVKNDTVILSGRYGTKRINVLGYTTAPNEYKPISYAGGSQSWRLLMSVAKEIGGSLSFSK